MANEVAIKMREKIQRDTKIPGLYLREGKRRSTWYLYYRTKAKKERVQKLGTADQINLTRAREMARKILVEVDSGQDPAAIRVAQNASKARTLKMLRDEYDRLHGNVELKVRSKVNTDGQWDHILRILGKDTSITAVTRADVLKIKSDLVEKKYQANRTVGLLRHAYNLAQDWGWIEHGKSPAHRIKMYKETRRKRVPTIEEVQRLFAVLAEMKQDEPWFAGLIALLCFVGARKNEIMTSKREWWQVDKLVLPDSKTGAKIVPISKAAWAIFEQIPEVKGNPYLIVGKCENAPLREPKRQWKQLLQRAQIKDLRMHDLRRWFASVAISSGQTLEQTMQLMGHQSPLTTRGYAFLMDHAKKQAAENTGVMMLEMVKKSPTEVGQRVAREIAVTQR